LSAIGYSTTPNAYDSTMEVARINIALLNYADYSDERKLRQLISSYNALYALAQKGDSVAAAIFVDLKNALYTEGVLSVSQRECIEMCLLCGMKLHEVGSELSVSEVAVHALIGRGLKNMQKYLC
jgi:hypothetical protein